MILYTLYAYTGINYFYTNPVICRFFVHVSSDTVLISNLNKTQNIMVVLWHKTGFMPQLIRLHINEFYLLPIRVFYSQVKTLHDYNKLL